MRRLWISVAAVVKYSLNRHRVVRYRAYVGGTFTGGAYGQFPLYLVEKYLSGTFVAMHHAPRTMPFSDQFESLP